MGKTRLLTVPMRDLHPPDEHRRGGGYDGLGLTLVVGDARDLEPGDGDGPGTGGHRDHDGLHGGGGETRPAGDRRVGQHRLDEGLVTRGEQRRVLEDAGVSRLELACS